MKVFKQMIATYNKTHSVFRTALEFEKLKREVLLKESLASEAPMLSLMHWHIGAAGGKILKVFEQMLATYNKTQGVFRKALKFEKLKREVLLKETLASEAPMVFPYALTHRRRRREICEFTTGMLCI